jgi:hypothetical protein
MGGWVTGKNIAMDVEVAVTYYKFYPDLHLQGL